MDSIKNRLRNYTKEQDELLQSLENEENANIQEIEELQQDNNEIDDLIAQIIKDEHHSQELFYSMNAISSHIGSIDINEDFNIGLSSIISESILEISEECGFDDYYIFDEHSIDIIDKEFSFIIFHIDNKFVIVLPNELEFHLEETLELTENKDLSKNTYYMLESISSSDEEHESLFQECYNNMYVVESDLINEEFEELYNADFDSNSEINLLDMNYCKSCYCVLGYNKYCVIHANGTLIRNTYNEKSEVFCSYVESCKTCTQTEYCMFYLGGYNVKSCGHLANSCSCGSSHTYKPTIKEINEMLNANRKCEKSGKMLNVPYIYVL